MNVTFFTTALIIFIFQATAQASTLRIACDDGAIGAEVSVNGKFKGECPVDVQVPGGSTVIKATKSINGQKKMFEQTLRIGDDVTKRVEISFGGSPTGSGVGAIQIDLKAVAQQRYEAELAAYKSSISACAPKYKVELARLEQAFQSVYRSLYQECVSAALQSPSPPRNGNYSGYCSESTYDFIGNPMHGKNTSEYKDYVAHYLNGANSWCQAQFTAPRAP